MKDKLILKSLMETAEVHAVRLEKAMLHIKPILPLTVQVMDNLNDANLGFLELLTSRFAKLQDLIGTKIFPQILLLLQEDTGVQTNLDKLHKLEKLGILPSFSAWAEMRAIRNSLAHDYPNNSELMCKNLERVIIAADDLLKYWQFLRNIILKRITE